MLKKIIILGVLLYFLVLIQKSFWGYFNWSGASLNLVLIAVVLVNFFSFSSGRTGFVAAGIGGLLLDLFSSTWLGVNFIILLVIALIVQEVSKLLRSHDLVGFSLILVGSILLFNLSWAIANWGMNFTLIKFSILAELIYNLIGGLVCFYLVRVWVRVRPRFLKIF